MNKAGKEKSKVLIILLKDSNFLVFINLNNQVILSTLNILANYGYIDKVELFKSDMNKKSRIDDTTIAKSNLFHPIDI